ncbi:sensor domain-containing protein [Rhodococcus sp. 14C212]|uniref:sensor domain-containing protein n=1 Tax=Rhodococcus sp. 14C212 TaxID=2711209 RepID=UPI0013EA04FD|nr:sensor domain-containing protein [Rhodococcus sp. 14C212]
MGTHSAGDDVRTPRRPRTRPVPLRRLGATVIGGAVLLATGCSATVDGTPQPEPAALATTDEAGTASRPLAELLLPPEQFPEPYDAVVLPPQAVAQAAPDLTGVPEGAKVDPPGCLPSPQNYGPDGTAMVVGTDNDSRATISVELVAVTDELAAYRDRLVECPVVAATRRGVTATVTTTVDPSAPPAAAGVATLAFTRTVRSGEGREVVTQSMTSRIAQVDDVRVLVTYMSFGAGPADTATLARVFEASVERVRVG